MKARSILLLLPILFFACAPRSSETLLAERPPAAGELLSRLAAGRSAATSLTGKGELTFETPDHSGSAFFRFAMQKPDSLLIRLQGPFGIEVGTLLLTPDASLFYNALENALFTGDATMRRIRSFLPFEVDRAGLMDLFAGQIPPPRDTIGVTVGRDGDEFTLTGQTGEQTTTWHIDPEEWTVTRMAMVDPSGTRTLGAEASEFRSSGGVMLPRRIRFEMPSDGRFLSLYFTSQVVNGDPPAFHLVVPPSARRVTR